MGAWMNDGDFRKGSLVTIDSLGHVAHGMSGRVVGILKCLGKNIRVKPDNVRGMYLFEAKDLKRRRGY